jgi:hypothetical protein
MSDRQHNIGRLTRTGRSIGSPGVTLLAFADETRAPKPVCVRAPACHHLLRSQAAAVNHLPFRRIAMPDVTWTIEGSEFAHCNCDYGCPCQFNARPTHGDCHAVIAVDIGKGHHGDTKLDGLKFAAVAKWPGAIHEGKGHILPIVDERASPEQREAILRIMSGQDTEPGATVFQVFSTTFEKVHEPVFARIEFGADVDKRTARLNVAGVVEARGEPIRNPITGDEHRARIDLPHGFEYALAEVGRGWAHASGPVALDLNDSHAHFVHLHMNQSGLVRA